MCDVTMKPRVTVHGYQNRDSKFGNARSDLSRIAIPVIAFNRKIRAIELSGRFEERYELLAEDH